MEDDDKKQAFVFRMNDHGEGPEVIREVFMELGWTEFDEETQDEDDWNLWWRTSRFRTGDYSKLNPWQRLNHFPGVTAITKKDSLARHMKRMQGVYGPSIFNFSPIAFNLPNDYTKFVSECTKRKEKGGDCHYWICKPADLSRGRGIYIFKEPLQLTYDCNAVVQQYVRNPMLISGYKFDLRIYVAMASFNPLRMYVYDEGLVRFSTEKFDLTCLDNMFAHLTNTSINKHSPSYSSEKERVGSGCKWTITQLRHYFRQNNINDQRVWAQICNIIILTIIIQAGSVPQSSGCFELYGFDILLDDKLKPWLLEVNFSPAMSVDCMTDSIVKRPMLYDLMSMQQFQECDKLRAADQDFDQGEVHTRSLKNPSLRKGRPLITKSTSVERRLPSIRNPNSKSAPNINVTQDSSEEEDYGRVLAGCGLPSVQQQSTNTTGLSSGEGFVTRRSGTRASKSFGKTSTHSLHSDSGVSSMSGSSERNDEETHTTRSISRTSLTQKPTKTALQKSHDKSLRRITSSKVTPRKSPPSTYRIDVRSSNYGNPDRRTSLGYIPRGLIRGYPAELPKFPPPCRIPQGKIGGFCLLFPFNDTTNKCSLSNMDTRLLIKETQKLLKHNFSKPKTDSSSSSHVQFSMPWPPWPNDS